LFLEFHCQNIIHFGDNFNHSNKDNFCEFRSCIEYSSQVVLFYENSVSSCGVKMKAFCVYFLWVNHIMTYANNCLQIVGSNDLPQCEFTLFLTVCFFVSHKNDWELSPSLNKLLIVNVSFLVVIDQNLYHNIMKTAHSLALSRMLVTKQISE
jgi:hypothetical protein